MSIERIGALRCPRCGKSDGFRLIADVECSRRIIGIAHGFVEIDGPVQVSRDELGTNFRFECRARIADALCRHRWPVPDRLVPSLAFYF